jgi:hypothetical protein
MIETTNIDIESIILRRKRKTLKKVSISLSVFALVFAGFFCWLHFNHLRHVKVRKTVSHTAPVATAPAVASPVTTVSAASIPAAVKPEPATSLPEINNNPALATNNHQATTNAANAGFADSLMGVITPSAKAETIQPEMRRAPKPDRQMAIRTAAFFFPHDDMRGMTPEQRQLKVAQVGFAEVMDQAKKYPDTYGFLPEEDLTAAKLGDAIPIYRIALQERDTYAGQSVSSVLKESDEWVYPVILDDRIRYFVEVRYVGHNYVHGLGSRALAMAYDKILDRWPASEGFHLQLVTIPNLPSYYFSIPELPEQNLTDITEMFELNPILTHATLALAAWR